MASCFFLLKQFEDVLVYLKSIKQYLSTDDDFNWNYGIACASTGDWAEAEEAFAAIQGQAYRQEGAFLNWSARIFIMQGTAQLQLLCFSSISCCCHKGQAYRRWGTFLNWSARTFIMQGAAQLQVPCISTAA